MDENREHTVALIVDIAKWVYICMLDVYREASDYLTGGLNECVLS